MIQKVDPYLPFYILEKQQHPEKKLWWLKVRQRDLDDVDRLVALSHGKREECNTPKDWEIMEALLDFFVNRWPSEWEQFAKTIPQIRATRRQGGYSQNKEMMYVASLPPRFERLIKAVFPLQSFNKDFIYKLITKFKVFKVGGET
jgi:hypothetical protein